MKVCVNGETQEVPEGATLLALLEQLQLKPEHIVAELNGIIVNRDGIAQQVLKDQDQLELIRFVGGG